MKIRSLSIKDGLMFGEYQFPDLTVIYSEKNSVGKTTLLRSLLYALGYPIPATRGLNFTRMEFNLQIETESKKHLVIKRYGDSVDVGDGTAESHYSMPTDQNNLHRVVFEIENDIVLENLLGAFYIDQEKGWTLLNRGKAIANNRFNIEDLIRGLSGRSCSDAGQKLAAISRELAKYRQMFDTAKYQADINARGETLAYDTPTEEIEKELNRLYCERQPIADEVNRLRNVIGKNTSFQRYIASMRLRVQKDGVEIPVTEETIVGYRDNVELLDTKRRCEAARLTEIDGKIDTLKKKIQNEATLFDVQTSIQSFDADVSRIRIDQEAVRTIIQRLEHEQTQIRSQIRQSIAANNPLVAELHNLIKGYANELGVDEKYTRDVFTSDLKSLSGAIFHKIVFAFKISYVRLISTHTKTILPFLVDSPNGREVEKRHVDKMMEILTRDFSAHQIIIATIHDLNLTKSNIIELTDGILSLGGDNSVPSNMETQS